MLSMSLVPRLPYSAIALVLFTNCEVALGPGREVILVITNVEAPAEIAPGSVLTVRVTVESGGCRRFDRVVATQANDRVTIVAHGHDTSGPGVLCTGDIRHTERVVQLEPPFTDPFTVVARQPSGPPTTLVVRVR
jgi:hypothetical protein